MTRTNHDQFAKELLSQNEDPLRNLALELIISWQIRTEKQADLSPEDQEIIMNVSSAYAEWKQQTLQEGQREGELRGQREMLVQFIALKFGSLPAQVVSQVQSITDTQKLQQLADALTRAPDLESFLKNL